MFVKINKYENIRDFFKIISALRIVSNEIVFYAKQDLLSVRALNPMQTLLPIITFENSYFKEYEYQSDSNSLSFQIYGHYICFLKKITHPSMLTMIFQPDNCIVKFEIIDYIGISHHYEFFGSETPVFNSVNISDDPTLSAIIDIDQIYVIKNIYKCSYIQVTSNCQNITPKISINSFDFNTKYNQSIYTLKKSHMCNIMTDSECNVVTSYLDFLTIIKIAKIFGEQVEIKAFKPGIAIKIKSRNKHNSICIKATIATLCDEEFVLENKDKLLEIENQKHNQEELIKNNIMQSQSQEIGTQVVPWKIPTQDEEEASIEKAKYEN